MKMVIFFETPDIEFQSAISILGSGKIEYDEFRMMLGQGGSSRGGLF